MNKPSILVACTTLSLLLALPVAADSSQEAIDWLDMMADAAEQGAFSVNLDGEVSMSQMGEDVAAKLTGKMTRKCGWK